MSLVPPALSVPPGRLAARIEALLEQQHEGAVVHELRGSGRPPPTQRRIAGYAGTVAAALGPSRRARPRCWP